ncbi:helix-turn-helix domain-containing protein [Rhodococcus daqingensis]|uniref:Helix-turn-helix domain-containing protein n=1 Tax=Rhodococcus daqingensis TaxID=2479363 RepID=A0ABW2S393_9NOCA
MSATHISVKDLAARWGCTKVAIYRQVESGRIKALRIGQVIRIPLSAVEEYEHANTTGPVTRSARRRA